jgi:uncharacterized protein (TIGR04141 family)
LTSRARGSILTLVPPDPEPKTQRLSLLLLKESVAEFSDALEAAARLESIDLAADVPFEGRLYFKRRPPNPPSWLPFVAGGLSTEVTGLMNSGTAAVLLLRAGERMFAYTFGYGRTLLASDSFVRDFGLKVVLNTVDADRLRSVDLRVIEDAVISRRTEASRASSSGAFGLDPGRDILRGVGGQPTEPALYGRQILGSDAVTTGLKVEFRDLATVAERFLTAYRDTQYQQRFGWVDQVKLVRDQLRMDDLDARLIARLADADVDPGPYLAAPSMLTWEDVEFSYTRDRANHLDLDLGEYLANLDPDTPDIETLRRHQVRVRRGGSGEDLSHWSVYSCLVFETTVDGTAYVLSEGQWFEVARTLVDQIREGLDAIPVCPLAVPQARDGEREDDYNARASEHVQGAVLLDKVLSRIAAERGPIEVCDVLTDRGQFLHIKRKTQSATLSHLFSQGRISAEVFRRDPDLRDDLRAKLQPTAPDVAARIPAGNEAVRPDDFEVVYGVITTRPSGFPQNLPFFSRLNLLRTYEFLTGTLGFRASVLAIGIEQTDDGVA